ncbi:MAG: TIGR03618 family F420-dependent PPOX class oxidoreductase [Gaiellaceae bacterium]
MRKRLRVDELGDLLELPLLAVLASYRRDGRVLLSPVWHEWHAGGFHVATSSDGVKVSHLRRDPRASIVVCEQSPPYRGVEVRARARLETADAATVARRIAIRYLGEAEGAAQAERLADDVVIRLEPGELRAWDFKDEY